MAVSRFILRTDGHARESEVLTFRVWSDSLLPLNFLTEPTPADLRHVWTGLRELWASLLADTPDPSLFTLLASAAPRVISIMGLFGGPLRLVSLGVLLFRGFSAPCVGRLQRSRRNRHRRSCCKRPGVCNRLTRQFVYDTIA